MIAFATVSFQTIRAALANPVKSLRAEQCLMRFIEERTQIEYRRCSKTIIGKISPQTS
jgi:hypothetical protein